MKIHIIFVSSACVSMVCVTPPVEVSLKEARRTSMQTHAFWNGIIIPCPVSDSYTQLKLEPKQWKYILYLFLWHVFPWYAWHRPSRFPRKRLVTLPCKHMPSGMTSSFPCPISDSYTQLKLEPKQWKYILSLFLWHVFSMVCVTPPVEVSPKEARHTSIQTHAFWNGIIYAYGCVCVLLSI